MVLNKMDLVSETRRRAMTNEIVDQLGWHGPVFPISAISGQGCEHLCQEVMTYLEASDPDD